MFEGVSYSHNLPRLSKLTPETTYNIKSSLGNLKRCKIELYSSNWTILNSITNEANLYECNISLSIDSFPEEEVNSAKLLVDFGEGFVDYQDIRYSQGYSLPLNSNLKTVIKYPEIIVVLTRFEYSMEYQGSTKILKPILCINGTLTESSKEQFKMSLFGI